MTVCPFVLVTGVAEEQGVGETPGCLRDSRGIGRGQLLPSNTRDKGDIGIFKEETAQCSKMPAVKTVLPSCVLWNRRPPKGPQ